MPGELDERYIRARTALLDAVEALAPHLDSIVLVGAQAIYLHTGAAELAVAEFTTDADFTVQPGTLSDTPLIDDLLRSRGFSPREHPGGWLSPGGVYIDIMVPEALAGPGRRGAALGAHGRRAARRAKGLEGALVDRDVLMIDSLDAADNRTVTMNVAGPAALLVAKLHKIAERTTNEDRVKDKDALDVFRLLQAIPTTVLRDGVRRLRASVEAGQITEEAIGNMEMLFGEPQSRGIQLALRATERLIDPDELTLTLNELSRDLVSAL